MVPGMRKREITRHSGCCLAVVMACRAHGKLAMYAWAGHEPHGRQGSLRPRALRLRRRNIALLIKSTGFKLAPGE